MANSNKRGFGQRISPFINQEAHAPPDILIPTMRYLVDKNPELKDMIRPDYQHNYFDPPLDPYMADLLANSEQLPVFSRLGFLRSNIPKSLPQFKFVMSIIPIAQMQQLREQLYIARVGNLGTEAPCQFTRRHWLNRLYNDPEPLTYKTFPQIPLASRLKWFEVAVSNLHNDAAEEEYIRYRLCIKNRMPLVTIASSYNPLHPSPFMQYVHPQRLMPSRSCQPLLSLVHDANRYFKKRTMEECERHIAPFRYAMVSQPDLDQALKTYDRLQRCVLGREIRARLQSDPPRMAAAWTFLGRTLVGDFLPNFIVNNIEIHSNDVVNFQEEEPKVDILYDPARLPLVSELLNEIANEAAAAEAAAAVNSTSPTS